MNGSKVSFNYFAFYNHELSFLPIRGTSFIVTACIVANRLKVPEIQMAVM